MVKRKRREKAIPKNLSIMFSEWQGLPMHNPYKMPVFTCKMPDDKSKKYNNMFKCPGNCDTCKSNYRGCIKGENVYTDLH